MLKNTLKTAIRFFWKNRTYNAINILGLTVSMTSILVILLYIGNEIKYDSGIRNKENIYRIGTNWATMPSFIGHFLKDESDYIGDFVRVKMEDNEIKSDNEVFRLKDIGMVDANFFDVFNFNFILGNPENALKNIHSIVLTRSTSERIFGSSSPINKIILLKNKYPLTVTGVVENPDYFHLPFTAIANLESLKELAYKDVLEQKDGWSYFTYIVGKPGLTSDETEAKLNKKMKELNYMDSPFHLTSLDNLYFAQPLYYEGITRHGSKQVLYILLSIAVLLLVLACINFINLTNARANIRFKEVGIKKLVGGSRAILIIQLLIESVQIILFALMLAMVLLKVIQPFFCKLINKSIDFNTLYLPGNILIIIATTIVIGILAGLFPAYTMNSTKPIMLLKNKADRISQKSVFNRSLITFQYFISIVLIVGTLTIIKQLNFIKNKDLGFSPEQIVCIELNDNINTQKDAFKNELLQINGVFKAAYSQNKMGNDWSNWVNDIDGEGRAFKVNSVEPEYFDLMGITIKEGRAFQKDDVDKYYIINETAVVKYNLSNPLEKLMKRDNKFYPVIGVMKDFNFQSPQYPIEPVLFNFSDNKYNLVNLKITGNNAKNVLKEIEKVWKKFCHANAFEYSFMDELYNRQYKTAEQFSALIGIGGGIAIMIACLGILGLSISSAEQRIKEIGIGKINGATVSEVIVMLNRDFVRWVAVAFVFAVPMAYYVTSKWLESFAYKTALSWWIFALAGLLALGIALLTVS
jgi:putative ABC transport system permease protein